MSQWASFSYKKSFWTNKMRHLNTEMPKRELHKHKNFSEMTWSLIRSKFARTLPGIRSSRNSRRSRSNLTNLRKITSKIIRQFLVYTLTGLVTLLLQVNMMIYTKMRLTNEYGLTISRLTRQELQLPAHSMHFVLPKTKRPVLHFSKTDQQRKANYKT